MAVARLVACKFDLVRGCVVTVVQVGQVQFVFAHAVHGLDCLLGLVNVSLHLGGGPAVDSHHVLASLLAVSLLIGQPHVDSLVA